MKNKLRRYSKRVLSSFLAVVLMLSGVMPISTFAAVTNTYESVTADTELIVKTFTFNGLEKEIRIYNTVDGARVSGDIIYISGENGFINFADSATRKYGYSYSCKHINGYIQLSYQVKDAYVGIEETVLPDGSYKTIYAETLMYDGSNVHYMDGVNESDIIETNVTLFNNGYFLKDGSLYYKKNIVGEGNIQTFIPCTNDLIEVITKNNHSAYIDIKKYLESNTGSCLTGAFSQNNPEDSSSVALFKLGDIDLLNDSYYNFLSAENIVFTDKSDVSVKLSTLVCTTDGDYDRYTVADGHLVISISKLGDGNIDIKSDDNSLITYNSATGELETKYGNISINTTDYRQYSLVAGTNHVNELDWFNISIESSKYNNVKNNKIRYDYSGEIGINPTGDYLDNYSFDYLFLTSTPNIFRISYSNNVTKKETYLEIDLISKSVEVTTDGVTKNLTTDFSAEEVSQLQNKLFKTSENGNPYFILEKRQYNSLIKEFYDFIGLTALKDEVTIKYTTDNPMVTIDYKPFSTEEISDTDVRLGVYNHTPLDTPAGFYYDYNNHNNYGISYFQISEMRFKSWSKNENLSGYTLFESNHYGTENFEEKENIVDVYLSAMESGNAYTIYTDDTGYSVAISNNNKVIKYNNNGYELRENGDVYSPTGTLSAINCTNLYDNDYIKIANKYYKIGAISNELYFDAAARDNIDISVDVAMADCKSYKFVYNTTEITKVVAPDNSLINTNDVYIFYEDGLYIFEVTNEYGEVSELPILVSGISLQYDYTPTIMAVDNTIEISYPENASAKIMVSADKEVWTEYTSAIDFESVFYAKVVVNGVDGHIFEIDIDEYDTVYLSDIYRKPLSASNFAGYGYLYNGDVYMLNDDMRAEMLNSPTENVLAAGIYNNGYNPIYAYSSTDINTGVSSFEYKGDVYGDHKFLNVFKSSREEVTSENNNTKNPFSIFFDDIYTYIIGGNGDVILAKDGETYTDASHTVIATGWDETWIRNGVKEIATDGSIIYTNGDKQEVYNTQIGIKPSELVYYDYEEYKANNFDVTGLIPITPNIISIKVVDYGYTALDDNGNFYTFFAERNGSGHIIGGYMLNMTTLYDEYFTATVSEYTTAYTNNLAEVEIKLNDDSSNLYYVDNQRTKYDGTFLQDFYFNNDDYIFDSTLYGSDLYETGTTTFKFNVTFNDDKSYSYVNELPLSLINEDGTVICPTKLEVDGGDEFNPTSLNDEIDIAEWSSVVFTYDLPNSLEYSLKLNKDFDISIKSMLTPDEIDALDYTLRKDEVYLQYGDNYVSLNKLRFGYKIEMFDEDNNEYPIYYDLNMSTKWYFAEGLPNGTYTVNFYRYNSLQNIWSSAPAASTKIKIGNVDTVKPELTETHNGTIYTFTGQDIAGTGENIKSAISGIDKLYYSTDNGTTYTEFNGELTYQPTQPTVKIKVVDRAGNETIKSYDLGNDVTNITVDTENNYSNNSTTLEFYGDDDKNHTDTEYTYYYKIEGEEEYTAGHEITVTEDTDVTIQVVKSHESKEKDVHITVIKTEAPIISNATDNIVTVTTGAIENADLEGLYIKIDDAEYVKYTDMQKNILLSEGKHTIKAYQTVETTLEKYISINSEITIKEVIIDKAIIPEEPTDEDIDDNTPDITNPDNEATYAPQTQDNTQIILWFGFLAIAFFLIVVFRYISCFLIVVFRYISCKKAIDKENEKKYKASEK